MTWRVARSLDTLLDELNTAAPNRSKISDGSIGDAAHATRTSDHNPWITAGGVGIVRARDFTHDPTAGLDCNQLAAGLVALLGSHPALATGAYVIWQRRIFSADRRSEGWRPYSGSNPHTAHLHVSVTTLAAGFDTTQRWGVLAPPAKEGLTMDQEVKAAFGDVRKDNASIRKQLAALEDDVAGVRGAVGDGRQATAARDRKLLRVALAAVDDEEKRGRLREAFAAEGVND